MVLSLRCSGDVVWDLEPCWPKTWCLAARLRVGERLCQGGGGGGVSGVAQRSGPVSVRVRRTGWPVSSNPSLFPPHSFRASFAVFSNLSHAAEPGLARWGRGNRHKRDTVSTYSTTPARPTPRSAPPNETRPKRSLETCVGFDLALPLLRGCLGSRGKITRDDRESPVAKDCAHRDIRAKRPRKARARGAECEERRAIATTIQLRKPTCTTQPRHTPGSLAARNRSGNAPAPRLGDSSPHPPLATTTTTYFFQLHLILKTYLISRCTARGRRRTRQSSRPTSATSSNPQAAQHRPNTASLRAALPHFRYPPPPNPRAWELCRRPTLPTAQTPLRARSPRPCVPRLRSSPVPPALLHGCAPHARALLSSQRPSGAGRVHGVPHVTERFDTCRHTGRVLCTHPTQHGLSACCTFRVLGQLAQTDQWHVLFVHAHGDHLRSRWAACTRTVSFLGLT